MGRCLKTVFLAAFIVAISLPFGAAFAQGQPPQQHPSIVATIAVPPHDGWGAALDLSEDANAFLRMGARNGEGTTALGSKPTRYWLGGYSKSTDISEIKIGQIIPFCLGVRGNKLFLLASGHVHIFDISDLNAPRRVGGIESAKLNTLEISFDGKFVGGHIDQGRVVFDVTDPKAPKKTEIAQLEAPLGKVIKCRENVDGKEYLYQSINGRLGQTVLTLDDDGRLNFWIGSSIFRKFSVGMLPDEARMLGGPDLVLTHRSGEMRIFSTVPLAITADRLRRAHSDALAEYAKRGYLPNVSVAQLEDAGVRRLLDGPLEGLTEANRVLILNDYGFLLDKMKASDRALPILKEVVRLAPQRAVAWLNLADASRGAIWLVPSELEKAKLWKEAKDQYDRYRELTGKEPPAAEVFAAFDLPEAISAAGNVCDYVADAFSRGGQAYIASHKGSANVGETSREFTITRWRGSCATPYVQLIGDDGSGRPDGFDVEGTSGPTGYEPDEILIVPFKGKHYLVGMNGGEPYQVVEPSRGPICGFKRTYRPKLIENHSPEICAPFLEGKLNERIKWNALKEGDVEHARQPLVPTDFAFFDGDAEVNMGDAGMSLRVGHFTIDSAARCGCSHYGVALLDGRSLAEGQPNDSLLEAQHRWWHCGQADAALVKAAGQVYVEAWSGRAYERTAPDKVLLKLMDGLFQPVCRIKQVGTYVPIPPEPRSR